MDKIDPHRLATISLICPSLQSEQGSKLNSRGQLWCIQVEVDKVSWLAASFWIWLTESVLMV